jgi:hypothetical protein
MPFLLWARSQVDSLKRFRWKALTHFLEFLELSLEFTKLTRHQDRSQDLAVAASGKISGSSLLSLS